MVGAQKLPHNINVCKITRLCGAIYVFDSFNKSFSNMATLLVVEGFSLTGPSQKLKNPCNATQPFLVSSRRSVAVTTLKNGCVADHGRVNLDLIPTYR